MRQILAALGTIVVLLLSAPALAQGFYVGGSYGQATMDVEVPAVPFSFSGEDSAFKAFAGYQFGTYVAIEAFYTDFGAPDDGLLGIDTTAFGAEAVVILPIGDRLEFFGKAGIAAWDADFTGPGGFSDDGVDPVFGGGLAINVTESLAIRGEWEFYRIQTDIGGFDVDTEMISAGIQFSF